MSNIKNIDATDYSPEVLFKDSGEIKISGELRTGNPISFFLFLNEHITNNSNYIPQKEKPFSLHFKLTYIGSSNVLELFKFIQKIQKETHSLIWEYDPNDDEIKELGSIIKEKYVDEMILKKAR